MMELFLIAFLGVGTSAVQTSESCRSGIDTAAEFLACARAGTERFRDRDTAILEGYRRIGGDFPAMGEHWINVGRVFDGELDPKRPEVLSYVTIEGAPVLLGVAYALPLLEGESPPDEPVGRDAWHDHVRGLGEETFFRGIPMSDADGSRIAMLHAWIWSTNPQGVFSADNWAIPYLRLGLEVREGSGAARALALAGENDGYFNALVQQIAAASGTDSTVVAAAFGRARSEVREVLSGRDGSRLPEGGVERLESAWERLRDALTVIAGEDVVGRLDFFDTASKHGAVDR